jgi:catechol 2,3-dioxygenase-like lactoylglutathione lyase family enzyme
MLGDHFVFPIVPSKDLAASRAFYHDTLGLDIAREGAGRINVPLRRRHAAGGQPEHVRDGRHADPGGLARP